MRHWRATAEKIKELEPERVILATGSRPVIPTIPGLDDPITAEQVLTGRREVGRRVLILGGGLVGIEMAEHLHSRCTAPSGPAWLRLVDDSPAALAELAADATGSDQLGCGRLVQTPGLPHHHAAAVRDAGRGQSSSPPFNEARAFR